MTRGDMTHVRTVFQVHNNSKGKGIHFPPLWHFQTGSNTIARDLKAKMDGRLDKRLDGARSCNYNSEKDKFDIN